MRWTVLAAGLIAACTAPTDDDVLPVDDPIPRGPGLGNPSWDAEDLWTPVGWVDDTTGVPEASADFPITLTKPFGTNSAYMHGGYLVTLFAPDSGFGPGGLLFYDVSDPSDPQLVTRIWEPEQPTGRTWDFREAHSMGFSHVGGRELVAIHTGLGLQLWDIQDVEAPEKVSSLDLPGVDFGDYEGVAWQLSWQGSVVYVAGAGDGLFLVDVSDPTAPVLADRGGAPNPIPIGELGGFRIGPVFTVGNLLVVSSMDNETGYAALDLSDPLFPSLVGTRTGLPKFYATCMSGPRVITSVRGGGAQMTIDDLTDPWDFSWELPPRSGPVLDAQLYCTSQDQHVFQGGEDVVYKVDISDPADPVLVGSGELGRDDDDHGQVTAFGNLVWVGNDHGTGSAFLPHQAEPDTTPPAVTFVSPADGADAEGLLTRVGVTFSDNVTVERVGPETFQVRPVGGAVLDGRWTVQGSVVNFEPSTPLDPGTTYELSVPAGGITDWAGNGVAEEFTSRFTTADIDPGDLDAPFSASIPWPGPVEVGTPVTLQLDVEGATGGAASWRFGEGEPWEAHEDFDAVRHTFTEPGHHTVIVSLTNGVRRISASRQLTVHRPLLDLPPTRSATLAIDPTPGGLIWTVNRDQDTVSALDRSTLDLVHELDVPRGPRSVAVSPDGTVWVSCQDDAALVSLDGATGVVQDTRWLDPGVGPAGIVVSPDGSRVFVALEHTGELAAFDEATGDPVGRRSVGPRPFGLVTDGSTVWVSRKISPDEGGQVYAVAADLSDHTTLLVPTDTTTLDDEDRARGVPNYLLSPGLSPDGAELWLPAHQHNTLRGRFRDGRRLTHETTVRGVLARLDLSTGAEKPGRRIDINDRPPGVDITFTPDGGYAFVALQGADTISVHDGFTGQPLAEARGAGIAVQGLAVDAASDVLYAHHFLSRTVTAHDLGGLIRGESTELPPLAEGSTVTSEALDPTVLQGKRIFTKADDPRMSKDRYIACVSCHLDGGDDGRTWDFTGRGEGLRNTIDLRGRAGMGHGPLHWTANFDEVQDFENDIRSAFGGFGFLSGTDFRTGTRADPLGDPKAGLSPELDALAAYVSSLAEVPTSPYRNPDGSLTDAAVRGETLFATLACDDCHGGPDLTNSAAGVREDVGTLTDASGTRRSEPLDGLDIPTLRGIWLTPPYLHDGSAPTLRAVLVDANPLDEHGVVSPLDDAAVDDLVAYLRSLD